MQKKMTGQGSKRWTRKTLAHAGGDAVQRHGDRTSVRSALRLAVASFVLPGVLFAANADFSGDLFPYQRGKHVVFSISAPAEAEVELIGDFNDWNTGSTPLVYSGDGVWEVSLDLEEGVYEYKFVVDGKQRLDPSNPDEVTTGDGSVRSRLRVREDGRVSYYNSWSPHRDRIPTVGVTYRPHDRVHLTFGGDYSYQRVDGSVLWVESKYRATHDYVPEVNVRFGYGWVSERGTIAVDFLQPLVNTRDLAIGALYTHGTAYENQSGVGWRENTLAALFFRHDFNDYYKIAAIEPYVRIRLPGWTTLRVSYAVEEYSSLTTQTDWSLFTAGRERFRPNPQLFLLDDPTGYGGDGVLQAARLEVTHDSRRARDVGTIGSYVRGFLELGDGDFSYARWVGDGRAYLRLGPPVHLALRFAASGRFGSEVIPSQKLFYVGGLGTARGHEFRGLYGDSSMLGGVEYTLLFGKLNYGTFVFYDAATAWKTTDVYDERLEDATLLQSAGVGFKTADDDFLIQFAKPFGEVDGAWETTVRLERTF